MFFQGKRRKQHKTSAFMCCMFLSVFRSFLYACLLCGLLSLSIVIVVLFIYFFPSCLSFVASFIYLVVLSFFLLSCFLFWFSLLACLFVFLLACSCCLYLVLFGFVWFFGRVRL